jgi:serine phosphatase RsbU (regulator of sigma subunit)
VPKPAVVVAAVLMAAGYLALAGYVWRHRDVRGVREATALTLATGTGAVFYLLQLGSRDLDASRLFASLQQLGMVSLPPLLWAFVSCYVGRGDIRPQIWMAFWIEPSILLTLLAVPATRDLVLAFHRPPRTTLGAPMPDPGPLFWPHLIYSYALILAGVVVLGSRLLRVATPYRRQAHLLILASFLPVAGNALYRIPAFGLPVDPTGLLVTAACAIFIWGLLRPRLLDVPAVTRNVVMDQLAEGVLLLDVWGRVADANPAAAAMLGPARPGLVGRLLDDVMPALAEAVRGCPDHGTTHGMVAVPGARSGEPPSPRELAISVTGLTDTQDRPTARIVVVRDVTERAADIRRLRELLTERTAVVETLEQSLRPGVLPEVPGLSIAARWVPAVGGAVVSGDFYDVHRAGVHQSASGRWAFVLGDVSGRGVQAAVLTTMARHTLRTLSAQGWSPRAVLEQLNQTLIEGIGPEQFCTVAYGQIEAPLPGADVRLVTLALGGHPPPLRRRRYGEVGPVGVSGTVLGLLDRIDVTETPVDLAPGDVLLLYTDGVPEARRGKEMFGEERLAKTLDEAVREVEWTTPGEDFPVARVNGIADLIVRRVREFADTPDDVAVLVLTAH